MTPGEHAESLIAGLGITSPQELDIEAIAFSSGVEVAYEPLSGCEATLVGFGKRAIATIKPSGSRGRERFSIGHELGHWKLHRGRSFRCRADDPDSNLASDRPLEQEADTFASHLLMPGPLFNPATRAFGQPNFAQLSDVAKEFGTSLMATAIRLARINTLPVIVACYGQRGLRWKVAAADISRRWWLRSELDEDSFTFDLLNSGKECKILGKQSADAWFTNDDAEDYEVYEQCLPSQNGEALVLIYLSTAAMQNRKFDSGVGNRKYNEHGSYVQRSPK